MNHSHPRRRQGAARTTFSVYVKDRRQQLGLTQAQLAELSGLSIEFIRDLEQGRTNLRLEKVLALVEALGGVVTVANKPYDPRDAADEE